MRCGWKMDQVTRLLTACEQGHDDTVTQILDEGVDVDIEDETGVTALQVGRQSNWLSIKLTVSQTGCQSNWLPIKLAATQTDCQSNWLSIKLAINQTGCQPTNQTSCQSNQLSIKPAVNQTSCRLPIKLAVSQTVALSIR